MRTEILPSFRHRTYQPNVVVSLRLLRRHFGQAILKSSPMPSLHHGISSPSLPNSSYLWTGHLHQAQREAGTLKLSNVCNPRCFSPARSLHVVSTPSFPTWLLTPQAWNVLGRH